MSTATPTVTIVDTFAEAFPMAAARAIITADSPEWAEIAARTMTGYASSVIGCDAEAGDRASFVARSETPDGRPGASVLLFAFSRECAGEGGEQPGRPVRHDLPDDRLLQRPAGGRSGEDDPPSVTGLRYFGDGWQISKRLAAIGGSGASPSWTASSPARRRSGRPRGLRGAT